MSLPPRPKTWISAVLATVGVPPMTATAPPLTRIWPAALRLTAMLLSRLSPVTLSMPLLKVAVTAAFAGTAGGGERAGGEHAAGEEPWEKTHWGGGS